MILWWPARAAAVVLRPHDRIALRCKAFSGLDPAGCWVWCFSAFDSIRPTIVLMLVGTQHFYWGWRVSLGCAIVPAIILFIGSLTLPGARR